MEGSPSADFVSQIQGWLLPCKDEAKNGFSLKSSSRITSPCKQRDSVSVTLSFKTTPEKKNTIVTNSTSSSHAEDVLQFWFGGDMHANYKAKWFPDGSAETQRKADSTILNLFGDLFTSAVANELVSWKGELRSTIALILILDQFSRHIYRLQKVTLVPLIQRVSITSLS